MRCRRAAGRLFELPVPKDLAADRAGGIFDQCEVVASGNIDDPRKIARHTHLMDAEWRGFWG